MSDLKALIVLFKAYHSVEKHIKKSLETTQLSVNEFAAMEALYSKEKLTTQALIDFVLIPNSSMSYVLDVLSKKGYILREKDQQDRRIQYLSLSPLGRNVFEEVYPIHFQHMRSLFDQLSETEEQSLKQILKKIGIHAEESINGTCLSKRK